MKQLQHFFIFLFVLAFPVSLAAQSEFGLHLQYNDQLGGLNQAGLLNGWGASIEIISPSPIKAESPFKLQVGARVDAAYTGEHRTGLFSSEGNEYYIQNSNLGFYALGRLSYQTGPTLQLYVEGMFGGRRFASTELEDEYQTSCPKGNSVDLSSQVIPSWGGSLGAMLHFSEQLAFDFRISHLRGRDITFVDLESVQQIKNLSYDYQISSGVASQLMFHVGFNFLLIDYDEMTPSQNRRYMP
ncbi:MAG: hypothetical protein AAFN10_13180 [Bacteroidota bacterium]